MRRFGVGWHNPDIETVDVDRRAMKRSSFRSPRRAEVPATSVRPSPLTRGLGIRGWGLGKRTASVAAFAHLSGITTVEEKPNARSVITLRAFGFSRQLLPQPHPLTPNPYPCPRRRGSR